MRVHAIQTGTVQVHERQRKGTGRGVRRFINTLLDSSWTEPLPIYAWVIEHPEGLLVVDTGETHRTAQAGYFPRWHPYFRFAMRARVAPEEEIGPRMVALGLSPRDVRWVVMTHLHTDHAGGLHHFPDAEVLVAGREFDVARGLAGKMRGYLPHRWPGSLTFTPVRNWNADDRDFGSAHVLTSAGDVRIVPTPGHSAGHVSVMVQGESATLFFAGDTSYTEANLLGGIVDGVASLGGGEAAAARTLARIRARASRRALVYLPTHDPDAERRLAERQPVPLGADRRAVAA